MDFHLTPTEPSSPPDYVDGIVTRVVLQKAETGWTILQVDRAGMPESWVGIMPEMREGLPVRATGKQETGGKFGPQFKVSSIVVRMPEPTDGDAVARFLAKLGVQGVGDRMARRIVDALGAETIPALEGDFAKVAAVKGIGEERARELSDAWKKHSVEGTIMIGLARYGIRSHIAKRVIKRYGGRALEVCEKRPFKLALEVDGIGFKTADAIARAVGIAVDSVERIEAGIVYTIAEKFSARGHCFVRRGMLIEKTAEMLDLDESLIPDGIKAAFDNGRIIEEPATEADPEARIYPSALHRAEVRVAGRMARLLAAPAMLSLGASDPMAQNDGDWETRDILRQIKGLHYADGRPLVSLPMEDFPEVAPPVDPPRRAPPPEELAAFAETAIAAFEREMKMTLAETQREAVRLALRAKVMILTGGPGCGKTQTSRAILHALEMAGFKIACCAPTGRAAKRLQESTKRPASTIHRLLEYKPSDSGGASFTRTANNPLVQTAVLSDEFSMTEITLTANLLDALDDGARIVIVGDVDQLPSVGPGAVLRDLIESGVIPVVRLTQIFRQAEGSQIIVNTHKVNRGEMPDKAPPPGLSPDQCDFFWIPRTEAASTAATALKVITDRLEKRGIATRNCMIVTPQKTGKVGVKALNAQLQGVLNPQALGKELSTGKTDPVVWRVGDPVRVTKNDYERLVFNGEVGWIKSVDVDRHAMVVTMDDGREVNFERKHFETVIHAYAATGHSMQGGQCEAIIVVMLREHHMLLSRPWLYTSLTRGQKLVVLIADPSAVAIAVSETRREMRNTGLKEKLRAACAKETP